MIGRLPESVISCSAGGTQAVGSWEDNHVRPPGKVSQCRSHLSPIAWAGSGKGEKMYVLVIL